MENWLKKQAQLNPNKTALILEHSDFTFKELDESVQLYASKLSTRAKKHDRIAVFITNSFNGYIAVLALQQLGAEIVFLNTRLSKDELAFQLRDSNSKFCLIDDGTDISEIAQVNFPQVHISDTLSLVPDKSYQPVEEFNNDDITSIMYTSGTSGRPKGVLQTFGNHFYSAIATSLNLGINYRDSWVLSVPLFHISGFSIMMRSLIYGIGIYLIPKFDETYINKILINERASIISLVPTMLKRLLNNLAPKQKYNSNFRCVLLGGGPIDNWTLLRCNMLAIPVIQSYGMTETASNVVALNNRDAERKVGSSGQALFPVQLRIAQKNDEGIGEIEVKSPTLAKSYLNMPELFKQRLTKDRFFKTGDIGYLDDEGFLFVKGRKDDMIISGGENIYPEEIENIYSKIEGILGILIIGKRNENWGQIPIAYVILNKNAYLTGKDLIDYGRDHMAHYKVPKEFRQVDHFPQTSSGKLLRRKISGIPYNLL
ncbi:o-succinylbenzoate--CoA ligase [Companilactobacillus baiquanensis]|uniref:2-succinylbenzoate--CoA ligase n=1 Tax=Companilactobacillus baiquanensis TaxID=2486005 RepID=A0ABW1US87_9LACO|nr:o-succinylbenzoate--CoA ligase [Companilactobacillus baiquanensis]